MNHRQVTEQDFRMPEYRDAKVEDYEFRADGKLVRKDRWEQAVQSIRFLVGIDGREFEIPDVVAAVRRIAADQEGWISVAGLHQEDYPHGGTVVSIRLTDGSVLKDAVYTQATRRWKWRDGDYGDDVVAYRES